MTQNESLNYVLLLIALSKEAGFTLENLVTWYHDKFREIGFYEFQMSRSKLSRESDFIKNLVTGRKNIYKNVEIEETDAFYQVISSVFLLENTVYFDVLDISKKEFYKFAEFLIKSHANLLDIPIHYVADADSERITVYKSMEL